MIHALLDATQVLGAVTYDGSTHDVVAEAVANHDRRTKVLTVSLRAFLRAGASDEFGKVSTPPWLPALETVTEHVEIEEATEMAKDIFASWRRKVSAAIPG